MGECGMRGGYVELVNMDPDVYVNFKKMISAKLCSTVLGQAVVDTVVNPPKPGEPSYDLWLKVGCKVFLKIYYHKLFWYSTKNESFTTTIKRAIFKFCDQTSFL